MTNYTIFGTGSPTGITASGDTTELSVSTAFYALGVTGWRIRSIRVWIPAGTAPSGLKAYLWIGTGNTPDSMLATADFGAITAGAWNTVNFSSPISMIAGRYYWAQVYFPAGLYGAQSHKFSGGSVASVDYPSLYAAYNDEVTTGNGSYVLGAPGQAPDTFLNATWYGVDVITDDGSGSGGPGSEDDVGIADEVTAVRSGLPTEVHASATAADVLGLSTPATGTFPIGAATAFHTQRRGLFDTRVCWGSVINDFIHGPSFFTDPAGSLTVGLEFHVQWPVRLVACRIYKAPNLAGTVPIRVWDLQGVGGAARELAHVDVTWVADEGGWRDIVFPTPIDLTENIDYTVSYYSPNSAYAMSTWVFHVWNDVNPPLVVKNFNENTKAGGSSYRLGSVQEIPATHIASNYYIEPIVEWDSTDPVFVRDPLLSYYDQFVNGVPNHRFMWAVFYADPEFLQDYKDMGLNTLIAGYGTPAYVPAVKAAEMDHYPAVGSYDDPLKIGLRAIMEDPDYAALVKGYTLADEPDLVAPYRPPSTLQLQANEIRRIDSTRPINLGLSRVVGINQTFYHNPQGSTMNAANQLWREWAAIPDILSGNFYTLAPDADPSNRWGVYTYPLYVRHLRQLNEGRTPIFVIVDSTSETADYPVPDRVRKAIWACIIEGVEGVCFFDHRFGNANVARDFAHMLHNPPMKAAMTALIVRVNALVDAVLSLDTGLVTAVTSSNKTSGPWGGTFGVPMHYTTRADDTYEYLFAMGIRPGSTTATFTVPSWAGETLDVIDESRTVTVDGSGVLTDTFAADYSVHLYRKG